jgi:hypothetical protein
MTPLQLHREIPTQRSPWPPYALAIVAGAAVAMFIAVALLAWQVSRQPEVVYVQVPESSAR